MGAIVSAQIVNFPNTGRSAGMAGTFTVLSDGWSGFRNQAGMALMDNFYAGIHVENHFLVPENSTRAVAIGCPVWGGVLGINYSLFGYVSYYESRAGLAVGKSLGSYFSAGIQINHLAVIQWMDYGNMHAVVPEGGILAQPLDGLLIGFHVFNPARQHFPRYDGQPIPSILRIGMGYRIIDEVFLAVEAEKEILVKEVIRVGMEYEMVRDFNLRLGFSTDHISRYSIGLGYVFKSFAVDFALSNHQWLGFTPYVTLTYGSVKAGK
jgi:hypothetical protein